MEGRVVADNCRNLFDELRFSDWPHRLPGCERLNKYVMFDWLIGHAVRNGITCECFGNSHYRFRRGASAVDVTVVSRGLLIEAVNDPGDSRSELIETKY